ncbi:MAG: DUF4127 family protein, partial [Candidatus Eremiobacterota bacterium]
AQARAARVPLRPGQVQLWIYGPEGVQLEAAHQADGRSPRDFVRALRRALDAGTRVTVADVAHANGGDRALIEELIRTDTATRLVGYAAWNTAGNTLGTALATAALWPASPTADQEGARRSFLLERLLDDGFYQSRVRSEVATRLGGSSLGLESRQAAVAVEMASRALQQQLDRLAPGARAAVSLPWDRLFEVRVDVAGV